jgi:hypothetical protein
LIDEGRKDEARLLLEEARKLDPNERHPFIGQLKKIWVAHFEPL